MIGTPTKPQKSNEWYTPAKYIEAARLVMGGIDLDPASCALANETVRAKRYFDEATDGLAQSWAGRVWLNPPFGRANGSGASKIKLFVAKLIDEYQQGYVSQAIALLPMQTNASWFQWLWDYVICFADHRLHFDKIIDGRLVKESRDSHMLGTIFVYLGSNESQFINVFSQFGTVARRIAPMQLTHSLSPQRLQSLQRTIISP